MLETLCFYHAFQHGSERPELKDSRGFTSVTALSSTFVFPSTNTFEIVIENVWTQAAVVDRTWLTSSLPAVGINVSLGRSPTKDQRNNSIHVQLHEPGDVFEVTHRIVGES